MLFARAPNGERERERERKEEEEEEEEEEEKRGSRSSLSNMCRAWRERDSARRGRTQVTSLARGKNYGCRTPPGDSLRVSEKH